MEDPSDVSQFRMLSDAEVAELAEPELIHYLKRAVAFSSDLHDHLEKLIDRLGEVIQGSD